MAKSVTLHKTVPEVYNPASKDFICNAKNFFYKVNKLYFSQVSIDAHIQFYSDFNRLNIPTEKTRIFFSKFLKYWNSDYKKGNECNVWKIADLGNNEVRICSVLAWLLDQNGSHGQGDMFLKAIIRLLREKSDDGFIGGEIKEEFISEGSTVYVESLPLGDSKSRVDIEIEGKKFLLFIEAKIHASEQEDQLKRYLEIADKKSAGRPYAISFLTLDARKPKIGLPLNKIICISWQDCARVFSEVIDNNRLIDETYIGSVIMHFCEYITDLGEDK